MGAQFRVQYSVNTHDATDFQLGQLPYGIELLMGPKTSTSTSITYQNGQNSRTETTTFSFVLKATSKGQFTIPAASVKVKGNTFESFKHKNGKSLMTLSMGVHSMESMFESEKAANKMLLWLFRLVGLLLVIAGLRSLFSILVTILKVLPPLAKVGELGVNLVTAVVGFIWTLLVILLAWVAYRPLLAVGLAVAIGALIFFLIKKSN